ncbi:MAG: M4 family metallopeptidase [Acidobacteriota bacterium]
MHNRCFILPPHICDAIDEHSTDETLRERCQEAAEHLHRAEDGCRPHESAKGSTQKIVADSDADHAVSRSVYHGLHEDDLPGDPVRSEGDEAGTNRRADEAYDGAGTVYDFYLEVFDRHSIDGEGMSIVQTVHHRRNYMNAYWNGEQMVYGDGDGTVFIGFSHSLTVIGHELSHGVVQTSGGLEYENQSGALNESWADIFGVLCEQRSLGHAAGDATWLVGHDIFGDDINAVALRSLQEPGSAYDDPHLGKDPQVSHMDDYVTKAASDDNGGVHTNSGIPNHAFYRFAVELGGRAWETPGLVWYDALHAVDDSNADFERWADVTRECATRLYGSGSRELQALETAWRAVGLG